MLQFTNGFSCAVDSDKESVIINFIQTTPLIDDEGNVSGNTTDPIASIVMSYSSASNLLKLLENALNPDSYE